MNSQQIPSFRFLFNDIVTVELFYHFGNNGLLFLLPLLAIGECAAKVLVARCTKDVAFFWFLGKRDTAVFKEADFPLMPECGGILGHSTRSVRRVHFLEQTFVPLAINLPVLHGM